MNRLSIILKKTPFSPEIEAIKTKKMKRKTLQAIWIWTKFWKKLPKISKRI